MTFETFLEEYWQILIIIIPSFIIALGILIADAIRQLLKKLFSKNHQTQKEKKIVYSELSSEGTPLRTPSETYLK